jgi:hypothetical protein
MVPQVEITPEHALHLVRSRMHPKIPLDSGIQTPSATRIVEGFRARFDKACDVGVWKRLSNAVLEPANRFDVKTRRQLKQEAIILGTLGLTSLGLALYFNLNAIAR